MQYETDKESLFNKYGAERTDLTQDIWERIDKTVKGIIKDYGSSYKLRELESVVLGEVSSIFAEERIRNGLELRKVERKKGV